MPLREHPRHLAVPAYFAASKAEGSRDAPVMPTSVNADSVPNEWSTRVERPYARQSSPLMFHLANHVFESPYPGSWAGDGAISVRNEVGGTMKGRKDAERGCKETVND